MQAFGIPNIIQNLNGQYVIKWLLGNVTSAQSINAYYTISNTSDPYLLNYSQNVFQRTSYPSNSSLIRVVRLSASILDLQHNTGNLSFTGVYTGTKTGVMYFSLQVPNELEAPGSFRAVNVTPNQLISENFTISSKGVSGTFQTLLYTQVGLYNITHTVSVVVLNSNNPAPAAPTSITITPESKNFIVSLAIILVIVIASLQIRSRIAASRYDPERARRLIRIKEQMNRSEDDRNGE